MRFYADARCRIAPRALLAEVADRLADLEEQEPGAAAYALGRNALRDGLIAAGMLEQALADAHTGSCAASAAEAMARVEALTSALAAALARPPTRGSTGGGLRRRLAAAYAATGGADLCDVVLPEGYLFYGIFPELYSRLGERLAARLACGPVVVVGVRSIGTGLSAAVQAGLRQAGRSTARCTVRPGGDPFAREVQPGPAQARAWREAARRGASFVVVDEGPGLSGSSLAAAVAALEQLGARTGSVHIACAAAPTALPMAAPGTRAIWQRTPWWPAQQDQEDFWHVELPALLGDSLGPLRLEQDLSWGAWSGFEREEGRPPWPQAERRKLLLAGQGRRLLAKFVGFGAVARHKAHLMRRLAAAGFVPPLAGQAHGMLLQEWIPAPRAPQEPPIASAARYYAYLRRHCPAQGVGRLEELGRIVEGIIGDWFGPTAALPAHWIEQAEQGVRWLAGDQRPAPVEWLQQDGRVLKADAADHFLDHSWARDQDICFDLAGFIQEHDLGAEQRGELLRRYREESGDAAVADRLPFFGCVYAAHRLAALDTAYHAAGRVARGPIEAERQRAGRALSAALRWDGADPCAC